MVNVVLSSAETIKGSSLVSRILWQIYTFMSQEQYTGLNNNTKIGNKSFERMQQFKYQGTTTKNQNCINEEIVSRLISGNVCHHSVQHLLTSSLLFKNIQIKIHSTIIFLLFRLGVKPGLSQWGRNIHRGCLRTGYWALETGVNKGVGEMRCFMGSSASIIWDQIHKNEMGTVSAMDMEKRRA
jgi:hypothetical protein